MVQNLRGNRKPGESGHMLPTTVALVSILLAGGTLVCAALRMWGVL